MSELDDLPSWAGRSTEEVQLPVEPPEESSISEEAAPEPPALPGEPQPEITAQPENTAQSENTAQPEITAQTAADQAPPLPPEAPIDDPEVARVAETQPAPPQDEPTVLARRAITAPAAAAVGGVAAQAQAQAPVMTEPVVATRRTNRLRPLLFGLLGLAILAGAAAVGYTFASRDSDATEATGTASTDAAEDPAAPSTDDGTDTATGETTADAGTDDATDTDDATTDDGADTSEAGDGDADSGTDTVTVEVDDDADADADGEADADAETDAATDGDGEAPLNDGDRQAIFRGGKVYLSGAVPSEEIGAAIVAKAEAVVGPGNVVNEYTIDPSTTIVPGSSAPLYVEDVVLFEFNSIEVARPFLPILDLGTLLLRQNPQASVTVVTRTDAVGSEEVNLEVARRRAQAVINYWLGQGVNADQILADPRGEEGASEDDDAETAARQRRAEFIITGLLD